MRHRRAFFGTVSAIALAAGTLTGLTASASADPPEHPNVTICHAKDFGNANDPYNEITPNSFGDLEGHTNHDGPVFQFGVGGPQDKWGDIIPPFDFPATGSFAGLNWTMAGQAIFNNGCVPGTGIIAVTKVVTGTGTPAGTQGYAMTLTCLLDTTAVQLPGNGGFSLMGGQTRSFDVQAGVTCSVVEGPFDLPNFVPPVGNDGPKTITAVGQTQTITITNTFAAPATPLTPEVAPAQVTPAAAAAAVQVTPRTTG